MDDDAPPKRRPRSYWRALRRWGGPRHGRAAVRLLALRPPDTLVASRATRKRRLTGARGLSAFRCGEPAGVPPPPGDRSQDRAEDVDDRPRRCRQADLVPELGHHNGGLKEARASVLGQLAALSEREEGLEEAMSSAGRKNCIETASLSDGFQKRCGAFAGIAISSPLPSCRCSPATSKTSEPESTLAPLSCCGWTCIGSRATVGGWWLSIRRRSARSSTNRMCRSVNGLRIA